MNKWKNKITVKDLFVENPEKEDVLKCCKRLIREINRVKSVPEELEDELENIKNNFEIIRDCCLGEEDVYDYTENGDELLWFNESLDMLYDLGDIDKFILVD